MYMNFLIVSNQPTYWNSCVLLVKCSEVYVCMYTSYHSDNKSEKVVLSPARDDKQFTVALAFKLEVCPKFTV